MKKSLFRGLPEGLLLAFCMLIVPGCCPDCPPENDNNTFIKKKLAEGTPFWAFYTSTTIESFTITFPEHLKSAAMSFDSTHSFSIPGDFALAIGEGGNPNRSVGLVKASFLFPPLNLLFDRDGNGVPDTVNTGSIQIAGDEPDSKGSINTETGAIAFEWNARISVQNEDAFEAEPMYASASTTGAFDLNDGFLKEKTVLSISSGLLKGTIIALFYSKPPPNIACAVVDDCLQCASAGAACRVNGVAGICQQVAGGCACRADGKTLRIYRCAGK